MIFEGRIQWNELRAEGWPPADRARANLPGGGGYLPAQVREARDRLVLADKDRPFGSASEVSLRDVMSSGAPRDVANRWAEQALSCLHQALLVGRRPSGKPLKRLGIVASHATWKWTSQEWRSAFLESAAALSIPCDTWAYGRILQRASDLGFDVALRYVLSGPCWPTALCGRGGQFVAALARLPADAVVARPKGSVEEILNGVEQYGAEAVESVAHLLHSRLGLEVEHEKASCLWKIANCGTR